MAFIDEIKVHIKSGKGGDGVVRWRHEKGKEFSGPSGGNGGKGGDVYVRAVRDLGILARYRMIKEFKAEDGGAGMRNSRHGANGQDLVIDLPIGSVVSNLYTKRKVTLLEDGQEALILTGGRGGLGNEYFKSSTNTRPDENTNGRDGEEADFYIELELAADAGFIGLPNAGKSSLLNAITNAGAKVGSYAFTTLEPNLGAMYGFVLADIPGLIEGAGEGKGLGHKFLRHIKRTKMLVHCISLENENIGEAYDIIRNELKAYGEGLTEKQEIIVLTKTDLLDKDSIKKIKTKLIRKCKNIPKDHIFEVSIIDDQSIKNFSDSLVKILREIK